MSAIAGIARLPGRPRVRWRLSVSPSLVLFMSVFTSQAAVLVLSPVLVEVARDLDVSTAVAGQLRVFAAPVAAVVAVLVVRSARRLALRSLLCAGTALVAAGSLASAAAPSFVVLALAQVPIWIGVAVLVTGGVGELLAMSAWAGMLVFSGALFVEVQRASTRLTGLLLATVAVAYLVGNSLAGRIDHRCFRRTLAWVNVAAGALVALTWVMTPNVVVSVGLFSFAAFVVGARTVVGTSYGFALAGDRRLEVGAVRAVTTHAGYLVGSFVGGAALAAGGPAAVGVAFGMLFIGATVPFVTWTSRKRHGRAFAVAVSCS